MGIGGAGLKLRITSWQNRAPVAEVAFQDFPVRIGRDALAEVSLPYGFVTRWHAILTLDGDAVLLWDLGSTNGTLVGGMPAKLPPHEKVDLRRHGMTFRIGPLEFAVSVTEGEPAPAVRERGGPTLAGAALRQATAPGGPPIRAEAHALADGLRGAHDTYRGAWGDFMAALRSSLAGREAALQTQVLRALAARSPALALEPEFVELAASLHLAPAELRPEGALREEDVALRVLRELAQWYQTPHPLSGAEAIAGFGRKLQDCLDALFGGFVPMRDGLKNFEDEFEVPKASRSATGASLVTRSETPLQVGSRALDWTDPRDGARAFKRLFADLMIHNMSLISGVLKGATVLVHQLSPEAIAEALSAARGAGEAGAAWGPFRYRALWRTLERRHADLVKEENETFTLLFGREFAATYQQFFSAASAGNRGAPAPQPTPITHGQVQGPTGTVVVAPRART